MSPQGVTATPHTAFRTLWVAKELEGGLETMLAERNRRGESAVHDLQVYTAEGDAEWMWYTLSSAHIHNKLRKIARLNWDAANFCDKDPIHSEPPLLHDWDCFLTSSLFLVARLVRPYSSSKRNGRVVACVHVQCRDCVGDSSVFGSHVCFAVLSMRVCVREYA